jgi:hypothetical protein
VWLQRNRNWLGGIFAGLVILSVPSIALADSTTIETRICASFTEPTITAPSSGIETDNASITVTGVGEPGMAVSILRNGVVAGTTTAVVDGSYGIEIGLTAGDNTLVAREVNECSTVEDSSSVSVHRTVVETPQEPTPSENGEEPTTETPTVSTDDTALETVYPALPVLQIPIVPTVDTPGFLKPTITTPPSGAILNTTQVWVGGRAQPGSVVTIYLNDHSVAYGLTTEKGVYGALVSLNSGKNTIQVRSTLGNNVATSDSIEVTFEQDATLTAPVATSNVGAVVTQVTLVTAASVTVVGAAAWGVPELRHFVRLRWFK